MALSGANIVESVYNDRVLLLESNPELRRFYEEQLEFAGYEVHCAQNVSQALNVLEYVPVNLIVCNELFDGNRNSVKYLRLLRSNGIKSAVLVLTANEDRVWSQIPDEEVCLHTFPIPEDLDEYFKSDINQFVAVVNMVLDELKCLLIVDDITSESIEIENLLVSNSYRVCSVSNGEDGLKAIAKAEQTSYKFNAIILNTINRYYPGALFLEELFKQGYQIPVLVLISGTGSSEKMSEKTQYEFLRTLPKAEIATQLIPAICELIHS
ncbi:response regulator [Deltaproteobacteria bacterium TL4]